MMARVVKFQLNVMLSEMFFEFGLHHLWFRIQELVHNDVVSTSGGVPGHNLLNIGCAHVTDFQKLGGLFGVVHEVKRHLF